MMFILFARDNSVDFMSFRLWVGLWVSLVLVIIVAFDLSALVRYITRFTEESFAVLISIIFIFESFAKLAGVWKTHPIHMYAESESENYTCHCQHPKAPALNSSMSVKASDIYKTVGHEPSMNSWTSEIYEDCITHMDRIIVRVGCIRYSVHVGSLRALGCYVIGIDRSCVHGARAHARLCASVAVLRVCTSDELLLAISVLLQKHFCS